MNDEKTIISLELLMLNDLLHSGVIDKDIYDRAACRIIADRKDNDAADKTHIIISP